MNPRWIDLSVVLAIHEQQIAFEKVGKGEIDQPGLASWLRSHSIAYSDEFGHLFRGIPATCSEDNRPSVPRQIGHLVGAKRRWYFVTSQSLFC